MPVSKQEMSATFNRQLDEWYVQWDNRVDDGEMTDHAMHRKLAVFEEIGALLQALADGQAAVSYARKPPREPAPMIRLPWVEND
jgi:hypothetical protein